MLERGCAGCVKRGDANTLASNTSSCNHLTMNHEPEAPAELPTRLTGEVAAGYVSTLMAAANAGVGLDVAAVAADAVAAQRGDAPARARLRTVMRSSHARGPRRARAVVVLRVPRHRPGAARRPRGRAARLGVRARSPSRQDPDRPGPASGRLPRLPSGSCVGIFRGSAWAHAGAGER
jgi:hypothetical protein